VLKVRCKTDFKRTAKAPRYQAVVAASQEATAASSNHGCDSSRLDIKCAAARKAMTARLPAVTAALMVVALGIAARQAPPLFRVDAELVVVDLVATDRDGNFVADLQPEDIELLEDGKPQKVQFVQMIRATSGPGEAAREPIPTSAGGSSAAPGGSSASGAAAGTAIAIVLDMSTIPADAIGRVRDVIVEMAEKTLPADARILIASVADGLTVHQFFTSDRDAVKTALRALPAPAGVPVGFAQMLDVADQLCETAATAVDPMPAFQQMVALAKMMLFENQKHVTSMANALQALSRSMAALPGRKHVVLYSVGYPLDPLTHVVDLATAANSACAGTDTAGRGASAGSLQRRVAEELSGAATFNTTGTVQGILDRANRGQVSFYTVDPRGLMTTSARATQRVSGRMTRSGQLQRFVALETTLPQEFLRVVAGDTGGRAFLNTNDLTAGVRRAWTDASEYYLIGYKPATPGKAGTYHRIELRLRQRGLDLRYRRGYHTVTPKDLASSDIEQALRSPTAFEQTGLEIDASFTDRGKLRVVAFVPPSAIRFAKSERGHTAEISVHATLRDEKGALLGGKPLFGRDITMRLSEAQLETLLKSDNVEIPVEVDPPAAAKYRLTVAARESGGWIGARAIDLTLQR
jgi:VWFA-related protein